MVDSSVILDDFLICEDIRPEKSGANTLVGVIDRVMNVPILPMVLPKLAFFVRVRHVPPGSYNYSLKVVDQTRSKQIATAGHHLDQPEAVESGTVCFLIHLAPVEFRSWGQYKCTLDIEGLRSFEREFFLRPLNWDMLYLRCKECERLLPSGIAVDPGTKVNLQGNSLKCPICKHENSFGKDDIVRIEAPQYTIGD